MTTPAERPTSRSASFIGSLNLAGRILERLGAFGQIILIAAALGATTSADLYFIASIGPLMIGGIVGEALYATVLPSFARSEGETTVELARAGFWVSLALLVSLTVAYVVVAVVVVSVAEPAGSGRPAVWVAFAPIAFFLALGGYLGAVLLRLERYVWPSFRAAVATLVGLVLSALALAFSDDVLWIALGVSAGYAVACVLLIFEVGSAVGWSVFGVPSRASIDELARLWRKLVVATTGGVLGGQAFVLVERALAASLGVGAVASISYARGVAFTPNVIAQSISHGIYPGMLRAHALRNLSYVRNTFVGGLRITLFVALCTAAFMALYAGEVVELLFDRGSLSTTSLLEIEHALAAFSVAIVGTMLLIFTARIFAAVDHFRGIVTTQGFALVLYVPLALILRPVSGPAGLALAFGAAELAGGLLGVWLSSRRAGVTFGMLARDVAAPALSRATLVAVVLAGTRYAFDSTPAVVAVLTGFVGGGIAAGSLLWLARWPEADVLRRVARRVRVGTNA